MKKIFGILVILILSYWAMKLFFVNGYFSMHDDTQVARVVVMGNALKQGQFPVRWVSDLGYGYGYPLFNFYGPLPYYIGGTLYAFGVDSVIATKWMFGIGMVLAGIFLYLFLDKVIGFFGAITGAVVFLYAPYHAVQVYIRGSVGEYWATAFLPVICYGFWNCIKEKQYRSGILLGAIGIAGVITSHTLLGFLSILFMSLSIVLYISISLLRKTWSMKEFFVLMSMIVLGFGLSCFFWLPAFYEMHYTSVSSMISTASTNFFDHFVCVSQLWNASWGYGGSTVGCIDGMSLKLGKIHILILILSSVLFVMNWKRRKTRVGSIGVVGVVLTLVSVLLMLPISKFLWTYIPYAVFIQYPWRLLSFATLGIALMSVLSVSLWKTRIVRMMMAVVIVGSVIFINAKNFQPQYTYLRDTKEYETGKELRYNISKISDEYLPESFVRPQNIFDLANTVLQDSNTYVAQIDISTDVYKRIFVDSKVSQLLRLNITYFPGWRFYVNQKEVTPTIIQSIPFVTIPEGKSIIEARFTNTPIRVVANILSICFLALFFIIAYGKKTNA